MISPIPSTFQHPFQFVNNKQISLSWRFSQLQLSVWSSTFWGNPIAPSPPSKPPPLGVTDKTRGFWPEKSELHHNKAAKSQTTTQKGKQIEALWICKDKQSEGASPFRPPTNLRHPFVYLSIEKTTRKTLFLNFKFFNEPKWKTFQTKGKVHTHKYRRSIQSRKRWQLRGKEREEGDRATKKRKLKWNLA